MHKGKDNKEGFFKFLNEIEKNTSIKSVLRNGQNISFTLHKGKNGINWSSIESAPQKNIDFYRGNKLDDLYKRLEMLDTEEQLDYMDVLVLKESFQKKGYATCEFYQIDPFQPYSIEDDGTIYMPIVQLEVGLAEYKAILETRIALYDGNVIYPIRKIAVPSVGAFLDARGFFKKTDNIPLGQGICLAEKLSEHDRFSVITRGEGQNVRPIIGMTAYREKGIPTQVQFFKKSLDHAAQQGIYTVGKWKITDEISQLDIYPLMLTVYKPVIRLMTSDMPGVGWSLKAYASIGPGMVEIKNNVIRHSGVLNMETLFDGVYEEIKKFDELLKEKISYNIIPADYKGIKRIIGKKRALKHDYLEKEHAGERVLYDLSEEIISNTFEKMPTEQMAGNLSREYYEVITQLAEKSHV